MTALQALLNFHTRAISNLLQEGHNDRNTGGIIESHFRQSLALVIMTSGRGARVPHLLQSVSAEYLEAGRAGRLPNLDSIREDDPRVLNNLWYNVTVAGTPEPVWQEEEEEQVRSDAVFVALNQRSREVELRYLESMREKQARRSAAAQSN